MKKQKIISIMLTMSMTLTLIPTTVFALESNPVETLEEEDISPMANLESEDSAFQKTEQETQEITNVDSKEKQDSVESLKSVNPKLQNAQTLAAPSDIVYIPDKEVAKQVNRYLRRPENTPITYEDMASLKNLVIDATGHDITDLEGIQYAINLSELTINRDCKNIQKINQLKNLEKLHLRHMSEFNLTMLDAMPNLTTLELFDVEGLKDLNGLTKEKFPQLEILDCWRCDNLEDISVLKNQHFPLKHVNLEGDYKLSDISPLTGYTSLNSLILEKVKINEQNRESYKNTVRSLTGLEKLSMPYCEVTDADVDMFFPLNNLKSLVLNINNITNTEFCDKLPENMETLSLYANEISNMDNLARFKNIKIIGMGRNKVTDFRFAKNLKKLTNGSVRHGEGDKSSPCTENYSIGSFDNPVEIEGDLIVKNPFIDIDGHPISFENMKISDEKPSYTVSYNKETNEIIFHNLKGNAYVYVDYDLPVSDNKVKHCQLTINAHTRQKKNYSVKYDWGQKAPTTVKLPVNNNQYKTLDEAKKAVDNTFTKDTEVKETVNGIKGIWKFSGWTPVENNKQILFTGKWEFYPAPVVINAVPVINATDKTLTVGDKFDELFGVTANDKEDGDLTDSIVVLKNTVDTTKAGTYEVTYKVTDKNGASSIKSITVTVNSKAEKLNYTPVINATDKILTVGDKFNELFGVTANDKEDGNLTDSIVVLKNTVDTTKAGTYEVTYKVTDKNGASSIKSIIVTVKENKVNPPVKPAKPQAPKTGDTNTLGIWSMILIGSSGILTMISKKRKLFK